MKNPVIFYAVIALGVVSIAIGVLYMTHILGGTLTHPIREYAPLGVGVVLLIAGVAGIFMTRSKATA